MRIKNLLCSFALLALAGASQASAETIDPNNDFDCAVAFDFFHKAMVQKQGPADLREQTWALSGWFVYKFVQHPTEDPNRREHVAAIVKELADDPKAHGETLNKCIARAASDPFFKIFANANREIPPSKP